VKIKNTSLNVQKLNRFIKLNLHQEILEIFNLFLAISIYLKKIFLFPKILRFYLWVKINSQVFFRFTKLNILNPFIRKIIDSIYQKLKSIYVFTLKVKVTSDKMLQENYLRKCWKNHWENLLTWQKQQSWTHKYLLEVIIQWTLK